MEKSSTVFVIFFMLAFCSVSKSVAVAHGIYIVFVDPPISREQNIKILSSVLGSKEAAKKAIVYHYNIGGFAANLTKEQVSDLSKVPGVNGVLPNVTYKLLDRSIDMQF